MSTIECFQSSFCLFFDASPSRTAPTSTFCLAPPLAAGAAAVDVPELACELPDGAAPGEGADDAAPAWVGAAPLVGVAAEAACPKILDIMFPNMLTCCLPASRP
jgi:hypothetical protein